MALRSGMHRYADRERGREKLVRAASWWRTKSRRFALGRSVVAPLHPSQRFEISQNLIALHIFASLIRNPL